MPAFNTEQMGYSVEFSPFDARKLACSTAQNFGIIGSGRQYVLDVQPDRVDVVAVLETKDGCYDCSWSESNEAHLAYGCGDGSVNIWDISTNKVFRSYMEHTAEVYAVDWNLVNKVRAQLLYVLPWCRVLLCLSNSIGLCFFSTFHLLGC